MTEGEKNEDPMRALFRLLSLRHCVRSPLRTLLLILGIALGVATFTAISEVNRAILSSFGESVARITGRADLVISSGETGIEDDLVPSVAAISGIEHAAGSIEMTVLRPGMDHQPILLFGLDYFGDRHFMPMSVEEGANIVADPVLLANDPRAILVSRALAKRAGVKVGEDLELLTPRGIERLQVRGILEDTDLAASFGGEVIVMFLDAAQLAFDRAGKVDHIDVVLADGVDLEAARSRLLDLVAHRATVEPPKVRTRQLARLFDPIARSLDISGSIAVFLAMFLIYNAIGISVAEREREIGILRALGATKRRVLLLFGGEAAALGTVASLLGIFLGHAIALVALKETAPTVSRFYAPIRPSPPELTPAIIFAALVTGVITTLVAAYFPARIGAERDPAETIHHQARRVHPRTLPISRMLGAGWAAAILAGLVAQLETHPAGFIAIALFIASMVLMIPALIFGLYRILRGAFARVFGPSGRIGADNVMRSPGRSAVTVAALATAIGLSVGMSSWASSLQLATMGWLDRALPADLYVTAGSPVADQHNTPFSAEAIDVVRSISGIRGCYAFRSVVVDVADHRLDLVSFDTRMYFEELEKKGMSPIVTLGPNPIDPARLLDRRRALIGESTARRLGLSPGGTLDIQTPSGSRMFEILAVIVDYSSVQGTILVDRRWYLEDFSDDRIDTIDLFVDPDANLSGIASDIRTRLGRGASLYVVSAADLRREFRQALEEALSIFHSVDLIAISVAVIGVIAMALAAILDRIREIGVLRAIGASRAQVIGCFVTESMFVGICAASAGVLLGAPLGWVLVRVIGLMNTGWQIYYRFPILDALRISVLITVISALAGFLPGRRAANIDLPRALEHE